MRRLRNLPIGSRLGLAFGLVLAVLLLVVGVAIERMTQIKQRVDVIVDENNQKTALVNTMIASVLTQAVSLRTVLFETMEEEVQRQVGRIGQDRNKYEAALAKLVPLVHTAKEAELVAVLGEIRLKANKVIDKALQLGLAGRQQEAAVFVNRGAAPQQETWLATLQSLSDFQETLNRKAVGEVKSAYANAQIALGALGAVALILGVILASRITRSVTGPIAQAAAVAEAIAGGTLDNDIGSTRQDEAGRLLRSMDTMQQGLRDFIAAQSHMARQHELGEIDHRIPAEQFPGTYGEMARSVNELVDSHIDLNYRMAEVIKHYAVGDFSVEMPALPGKKAQLAEVCSEAKHNLVGMQEQILQLSEAAARGDFSVRGDADRFENAYRDMVTKLNQLMEVCDSSLSDVARVLSAIAKGDLTETIVTDYAGTFGQLKRDSNLTVEQLLSIVSKIQQASEAINAAASEIMAGNSDLSRRTEDQAAGRGFLQRGMEELTATVLQNAESAHQANQLAMRASDVALKGGTVVSQVVCTMHSIEQSSKEIFDIISVMEGIAFQTKILALNAAVEAARAGEQGRGFAVVASEVRNLAQRSEAAAKQIKLLIGDSAGKVKSGSELVDAAGKTMQEIVQSVQRVTDIMAEITSAQGAGIDQVNQAMARIDQTTQRNAALMEQAAAAARSMEAQAQGLAKSVAVFRVVKESSGIPNVRPYERTRVRSTATRDSAVEPGRRGNRKNNSEQV